MRDDFVMEQESFAKKLIEMLVSKFNRSIKFDYHSVIKQNDTVQLALMVQKENSELAKTIYLDSMFERWKQGTRLEDIVEQVARIAITENSVEDVTGKQLLEHMSDLDYLCDGHFVLKLVNKSRNEQYLSGKTYVDYLDLCIMFYMQVESNDGLASVAIPASVSNNWNKPLSEVLDIAIASMETRFPIVRKTMFEVLADLMKKKSEDFLAMQETLTTEPAMYVQTNATSINGASTLLYKGQLENFCREHNLDKIYVLPSSVSEVIIVPAIDTLSTDMLKDMIREVNDTQVPADEVLSYSLYEYSLDDDELKIVD